MQLKFRILISFILITFLVCCSHGKKTTKASGCKESNTGSYCFKNNTKYELSLEVQSGPPRLPGSSGGYKQYESILKPGGLQCFSDIPVGAATYKITNSKTIKGLDSTAASKYISNGTIFIDQCKQGDFIIK